MGIKCYYCSSENTHFKRDIVSDCCQEKKQGEKWFCRDCQSIFDFFIVYSDDEEDSCCNHKSDTSRL